MPNVDMLEYVNKSVYFCNRKCSCAQHGYPGNFPEKFDGVLLVGQNPGYAKHPYGDYKRRIWEYSSREMNFKEFQKLYVDEFLSNRFIGNFYKLYAKEMGLEPHELTFTNLVKCPNVNNVFEETMIPSCKGFLHTQIEALRPDVIVAFGRYAIEEFHAQAPYMISHILYPYRDEIKLQSIVSFPHPSRLRNAVKESKKLAELVKTAKQFKNKEAVING